MGNKKAGFTASVQIQASTESGNYYRIQVPVNTVESLKLSKGDLVDIEFRNMDNESVKTSRKLQAASKDQLRIDIPKGVSDDLDLQQGDLIDVFLNKK